MIYFIKAEKLNLIKIGYTKSINKRFNDLREASPDKLKLLAAFDLGTFEGEFLIKEIFKEYKDHNEWYRPGERLLEFIELIPHIDIMELKTNRDLQLLIKNIASGLDKAEANSDYENKKFKELNNALPIRKIL